MGDREDLPSFGRYQVLNLLGKGGTARVYRAMRPGPMGFGKEVALKVIDGEAIEDEEARDSLVNEARLGGVLRHRNIVAIDEFDQIGETLYIAMEYVDGWSLERILDGVKEQGGVLPLTVICDILTEVCAGLQYAHDLTERDGTPLNIIHRDLKPGNVMLSRAGEVKLADFGTAKASTNVKATQVGFTRGTPAYMSPEQVTGKVLDRRSDIFTMGSILFEMVTFDMVFEGDDLIMSMRKVLDVDVEAERERLLEAVPEFVPVFDKCVAKERDDRYQSTAEMADALRAVRAGLPPGPGAAEWLQQLEVELPVIKTGTFGTDLVRTLNAAAEARRKAQELEVADFEDLGMDALTQLGTGENPRPDDSFFPDELDNPTMVAPTLGDRAPADRFALGASPPVQNLGGTQPSFDPVPPSPDDSLDPSGLWQIEGDGEASKLDPYAPLPGSRPGSPRAPAPQRSRSGSYPGVPAPRSRSRSGSTPGAPAPLSRSLSGSYPGAPAPPSRSRSGSYPGVPAPPSRSRSGSHPGAQRPAPRSTPGVLSPPPPEAPRSMPPRSAPGRSMPPPPSVPRTPPPMPSGSGSSSAPPPGFGSGPVAAPPPAGEASGVFAAPEPPAAAKRSKGPLTGLAVVVLLGVAVAGFAVLRGGSGSKSPAPTAAVVPVDLAAVPAGAIVLGTNQDRDARPSRTAIQVPAFEMMTREVTVAQYEAGCETSLFGSCKDWAGRIEGQADDHPAVGVTWGQAKSWCASHGMRLPTESEWELAARGPNGRTHPWGDTWKAGALNYCDVGCAADALPVHHENDGFPRTAPAGHFTAGATPQGIVDLAGNAAEWTLDCWTEDHRARTEWTASGAPGCDAHVVRGGDWTGWAHHQTGWRRFSLDASEQSERIGFRCVKGAAGAGG